MRILIVGNGGRESALGMKLKEDGRISKLFFAPGNATTEMLGQNVPEETTDGLLKLALREKIDLTIVGPEAPLVDGIVDKFEAQGLKIFGACKKAAKLEGSKAFSKKFMQTHNIKTANAVVFEAYNDAINYVRNQKFPIVIKASGLASGKGVVVVENLSQAESTIHQFMIDRIYGDAGIQLVIEDYIEGFEASVIAFSNREKLFPCVAVKDYKKAGTGNTGPNTGGMGSVAPSPEFTSEHYADFEQHILNPTLEGLKANNISFKGFIFFGLMVTNGGTYLLEYNMRMGDPETQVIMELMENKLLDVINDCLNGEEPNLKFRDEKAVCLVMCSGGYPRKFETGFEIRNTEKVKDSKILFAGAKKQGNRIVTNGGRVLNLVATGSSFEEARKKVYADAKTIQFDYETYREDIGKF